MRNVIEMEEFATLRKKDQNFSVFQIGDLSIKFFTSPFLQKYCNIIRWKDDGYIEYTGLFSTSSEPIEDSIDLAFIAERLHLPKGVFKGIKEVKLL